MSLVVGVRGWRGFYPLWEVQEEQGGGGGGFSRALVLLLSKTNPTLRSKRVLPSTMAPHGFPSQPGQRNCFMRLPDFACKRHSSQNSCPHLFAAFTRFLFMPRPCCRKGRAGGGGAALCTVRKRRRPTSRIVAPLARDDHISSSSPGPYRSCT